MISPDLNLSSSTLQSEINEQPIQYDEKPSESRTPYDEESFYRQNDSYENHDFLDRLWSYEEKEIRIGNYNLRSNLSTFVKATDVKKHKIQGYPHRVFYKLYTTIDNYYKTKTILEFSRDTKYNNPFYEFYVGTVFFFFFFF